MTLLLVFFALLWAGAFGQVDVCSQQNPNGCGLLVQGRCYATLQEGVRAANGAAVGLFRDTVLTESLTVETGSVNIVGCGPSRPTIFCGDNATDALIMGSEDTPIKSVQLINFALTACKGRGLVIRANTILLRNLNVTSNGLAPDAAHGGGAGYLVGNITIDTCHFANNTNHKTDGRVRGTLALNLDATITTNVTSVIRNSVFDRNTGMIGAAIQAKQPLFIFFSSFTNNSGMIFAIHANHILELLHSRIEGNTCNADRCLGAVVADRDMVVYNTSFIANKGTECAALAYNGAEKADIYNSFFGKNTAAQYGGALCASGQEKVVRLLSVVNCTFEENKAEEGGAIEVEIPIEVTNCTFRGNRAVKGGAINVYESSADVKGCTFKDNTAKEDGGAIALQNSFNYSLSDLLFINNTAQGRGGAIYGDNGVVVNSSSIVRNRAKTGGGVFAGAGKLVAEDTEFAGNTAQKNGGAIAVTTGSAVLLNCTFEENQAVGGEGGGGYVDFGVVANNTVFRCNRAGKFGGGLSVVSFKANFTNETFENNAAEDCNTYSLGQAGMCIRKDANGCKCGWAMEETFFRCNGHCKSNPLGLIGCSGCAPDQWLDGYACKACTSCGAHPVLSPCTRTADTVCSCPKGKTGPACAMDCTTLPHCTKMADRIDCDFSPIDYSKGRKCELCENGYFVNANGSCQACGSCGASGQIARACTATEDTVCVCPLGLTGANCSLQCSVPRGCRVVDTDTLSNCTYSATSTSEGVVCLEPHAGYYLKNRAPFAITECRIDQWEESPPSQSQDRICRYASTCGPAFYEAIRLGLKSDRVCKPCSPDRCVEFGSACTATSDLTCAKCNVGRAGPACQWSVVHVTLAGTCESFGDSQIADLTAQLQTALDATNETLTYLGEKVCGSVVLSYGMADAVVAAALAGNGSNLTGLPSNLLSLQQVGGGAAILREGTDSRDEGLDPGIIAALVLAGLGAMVAVAVAGWMVYRKRNVKRVEKVDVERLVAQIKARYKWLEAHNPAAPPVLQALNTQPGWLPRSAFTILDPLGKGAFATVSRGVVYSDGAAVVCAVKQLNPTSDDTDTAVSSFLGEAEVLKQLDHPNVMKLIGCSMDDGAYSHGVYILLEHMDLGDLRTYIVRRTHSSDVITLAERLWYCREISKGLEYLASIPLVHRDIAARNVLLRTPADLTGLPVVKISDMGLARFTQHEAYIKQSAGGALPVRWMAPETLTLSGVYTEASDVWAFAVCVWEIFSDGAVPYEFIDNKEFFAIQTTAQLTLNRPATCPEVVYTVMRDCWLQTPSQRPTFSVLAKDFHYLFHITTKTSKQAQEPIKASWGSWGPIEPPRAAQNSNSGHVRTSSSSSATRYASLRHKIDTPTPDAVSVDISHPLDGMSGSYMDEEEDVGLLSEDEDRPGYVELLAPRQKRNTLSTVISTGVSEKSPDEEAGLMPRQA